VANIYRLVVAELEPLLDGGHAPEDLPPGARHEDHLLTAPEVAVQLGTSVKLVYRSAARWPFTRRVGRLVRFSAAGLAKWLERR